MKVYSERWASEKGNSKDCSNPKQKMENPNYTEQNKSDKKIDDR